MIAADDLAAAAVFVKSGVLAAFGGLVGHVMDVLNGKREWSWPAFLAAAFVAFFVGVVLGDWLPSTMPGRDGVLMVSGTSAYPLLLLLQNKVYQMIKKLGT